MKKYMWSIIACVVLLGGLAGLYALSGAQKAKDGASAPAPMPQAALLDLPAADVVRLETARDGMVSVFTKDTQGVWRLDGADAPLVQSSVSGLINGICNVRASVLLADAGDAADYGFNTPTVTHTLILADGRRAALYLGGMTASRDAYYLMLDGDNALYLLDAGSAFYVNHGLPSVLDTAMFEVTMESVDNFSFRVRGQEPVLAAKNPADTTDLNGTPYTPLRMLSPVSGKDIYLNPLDTYLVKPLADVTLETFVCEATADSLTAYGFDDPAMELFFEGTTTVPGTLYRYRLTVGSDTAENSGRCYVLYEGLPYIYETSDTVLKTIAKTSALQLVDRFVSFVIVSTVDSLTVDSRDRGVTHEFVLTHSSELLASGESKAHIAPVVNGQPVQDAAFRNFYGALGGMSFDQLTEGFAPAGEPAFTITYRLNTGQPDVVDAYYAFDNNFYIIAKGSTGALLVNKQYVNGVLDAVDDLLAGKLDE